MRRLLLLLVVMAAGLLLEADPAASTVWTTSTYGGGTITFDDWGFTGPGGRGALDFNPINGFGANPLDPTGGIGQIQHVVTVAPDRLTPDQPSPAYPNKSGTNFLKHDEYSMSVLPTYSANMDSQTNFYKWGYTSPAGSTFNNMQIDYDGDYFVPKEGMNFAYYSFLDYQDTTGTNPSFNQDTYYQFQPYAIGDAKGWCGSVLASHPLALEAMAGQVTFDFAFEVYPSYGAAQIDTQYVPGFIMRSYGTLTVDEPLVGFTQHYEASAVVNNTNPLSGSRSVGPDTPVDPNFYNHVSFMGGGVVPEGAWIVEWWVDANGNHVAANDPSRDHVDTSKTVIADASTPGATWHHNAFAGYAFLLRADALRTVDYFDVSYYGPAPNMVPEPGSILLLASGLAGLYAVKRRRG